MIRPRGARGGLPSARASRDPGAVARFERRIRLGCLAIPLLGMGFLAGVGVWKLITNGQLSVSGWIYIICFLLIILAGIRIFRSGRPRPGNDGPPN